MSGIKSVQNHRRGVAQQVSDLCIKAWVGQRIVMLYAKPIRTHHKQKRSPGQD